MPVSKRDLSYIWDMLTATQETLEFVQYVSQVEFEQNKQLRCRATVDGHRRSSQACF